MDELENFAVLNHDYCYLLFKVVILDIMIECRVSCDATLIHIMEYLKKELVYKQLDYDFSNALLIDPDTYTYLMPNMKIKEYNFKNYTLLWIL